MIDAMKQALDALLNYPMTEGKAITALRQAIEQAEKQEPVAWIQEDRIVPEIGYDCTMTREHPKELGYTPLYAAPPPRKEWVGLTDVEVHKIIDDCTSDEAELEELNDFAKAIFAVEAKLKERNT